MKKLISVILAIVMVVTLLPASVATTTVEAATNKVTFSSSYKSGKYYTALKNVTLTGDPRTDIVNIAKSQIGYQEGANSSRLSGTVRGSANYTEYGRWYGVQDMWCAMFVSWCAAVAGIDTSVVPKHCFTPTGLTFYKNKGRAYSRASVAAGKYTPQPGDIIYFKSSRNTNATNHIGIVTKYSNGTVYTIEGNTSSATISTNGGAVAAKSYSIKNTYIVYICNPDYSDTGLYGSAVDPTTAMSKGATGDAVKTLQRNLIGLGYLTGSVNGKYDSKVEVAVKAYEKAKKLTVDGVADSEMLAKLTTQVKNIQKKLVKLGYTGVGTADGIFGTKTKNGVKEFQTEKGIAVTGVADKLTRSTITAAINDLKCTTSVTTEHMKVLRKVIYAVETGGQVYGKADYSDFTEAYTNSSAEHAITIGAGQWYGVEAKTLLNLIRKTDPELFASLDTAGIAKDLDKKDWSTYRISKTSAKAKCIQSIISTDVGKMCQDQLIDKQMLKYMKEAYKLGVTDLAAQMMCANFRHQGGLGAVKRILKKTSKPYTLTSLYSACQSDTGNQVGAYKTRQKMVYNALKTYIGSGKIGVTDATTLSSIRKATTSLNMDISTEKETEKTTEISTEKETEVSTEIEIEISTEIETTTEKATEASTEIEIETTTEKATETSTEKATTTTSVFKTTGNLKEGSTGKQVKYLQYDLIGLGYLSGTADSIYGSKTKAAVKKYQKAKGLTVDGIAGTKTRTKLKNQVMNLQKNLQKLGYDAGTVDGIYGSKTKAAVKKFQKANGLTVDGIAGSKTLAKIKAKLS